MAIIPTLRCRHVRASVDFYRSILGFERASDNEPLTDPGWVVLVRGGDQLVLSSHAGDGTFGQAVIVTTDAVDDDFRTFRQRGLVTLGNPEVPQFVHEGPIDQSWGTREFYVNDPDGNTLRFVQGWFG